VVQAGPRDPASRQQWQDAHLHLLGRRLYETMLFWETADQELSLDSRRSSGQGNALLATGGWRPAFGLIDEYRVRVHPVLVSPHRASSLIQRRSTCAVVVVDA
jgi:hypothetical protein